MPEQMSRTSVMTIGFLLIFLGVQLNVVETFELTPQATRFWNERVVDPASELVSEADYSGGYNVNGFPASNSSRFQSPFFQTSFGNQPGTQQFAVADGEAAQRSLTPPSWICWPVFFLGTVFFLHGLAMRN